VGRNAFETAQETLADGFSGDEAVSVWMERINSLGQRYCALALDLILAVSSDVSSAVVEGVVAPSDGVGLFDPLFEGMFSYPDVPGEPVAEQGGE